MDDSNRSDASSPLAQYVRLLVDAPESLKLRLDRDSEAVRLLSGLSLQVFAPLLPLPQAMRTVC